MTPGKPKTIFARRQRRHRRGGLGRRAGAELAAVVLLSMVLFCVVVLGALWFLAGS